MPYGITQCCLPSGRGDIAALPIKAGARFSDPEGCKAEFTYLASYVPRWCPRPKMVIHPSTNRTQCGVTLLMGFAVRLA